jgi:uncharacterized protein YeaO (DUF488 family)
MIVHTIQKSRELDAHLAGVPVLDITVKSGELIFAPSREALNAYKYGSPRMTEAEYTKLYIQKMRESFKQNKKRWLQVARMDRVCFVCYCSEHTFCHRYILVELFEKVCGKRGIEFEYAGELGSNKRR